MPISSAPAAAQPSSTPTGRPTAPSARLRRLVVTVGVALALLAAPVDARPAAAQEWGFISGQVVFPAGVDASRMAEVEILVVDPRAGWSAFVHHPDAHGRYTIPAYPEAYAVQVRAPHDLGLVVEYYGGAYALSRARLVTVAGGRTTTGIDVQLASAGRSPARSPALPGRTGSGT